MNSQHLKNLDDTSIVSLFSLFDHPLAVRFSKEEQNWQNNFCSLFKEKIQIISDLIPHLESIYSENVLLDEDAKEVLKWDSTPIVINYIAEELEKNSDEVISEELFSNWMNHLKKNEGIKGKNLFMGLRVALTGFCHGPDLKKLIPLMKRTILTNRVKEILTFV